MAEQLRQRLALLGCELTLLFHDAKNWEGCQHLGQADLMMGDRLIGEAPEYATEQWLRCDMLWPNLLTGAQYAHLQATLDAVQSQPDARSRNDALRNVFNSLMEDAIMTPLFKYNYRISAPPGSMVCASTPGAGSTSPAHGCRPRRRERAGDGGRLALPYRLYSFSQELP